MTDDPIIRRLVGDWPRARNEWEREAMRLAFAFAEAYSDATLSTDCFPAGDALLTHLHTATDALRALVVECSRPDGDPLTDYMGDPEALARARALVTGSKT